MIMNRVAIVFLLMAAVMVAATPPQAQISSGTNVGSSAAIKIAVPEFQGLASDAKTSALTAAPSWRFTASMSGVPAAASGAQAMSTVTTIDPRMRSVPRTLSFIEIYARRAPTAMRAPANNYRAV